MRKGELEYFREVGLHETVTVTYAALAMSPDGSRFVVENEIWTAAGERASTVRSTRGLARSMRGSSLRRQPPCSRPFNGSPARRALSNGLLSAATRRRRQKILRRAAAARSNMRVQRAGRL